MDFTCGNCGKNEFAYAFREGENVCGSCGWCDPNLVYSLVPQNSKELYNAEKHHYVRKPRRGADHSRLLGPDKGRSGKYDRRYYWNERFNQWRNNCPSIPQKDVLRIGRPLYVHSNDPELSDFYLRSPLDLSRDDVALLCKKSSLGKHAEKWVQLKFKWCNFPFHKYHWDYDDMPVIPYERPLSNFPQHFSWRPNFLPNEVFEKLKGYAKDIGDAFAENQYAFHEYPYMEPYRRKSFLNFDFIMLRGLYMICPHCNDLDHAGDDCYVKLYSWMLKPLKTVKNTKQHVAWFYFLVGEMIRRTLYDKTISVYKWDIHPKDTILNSKPYAPDPKTCPQLLECIIPPLRNPALEAIPLRRRDSNSHPPLGQGGQIRDSATAKRLMPSTSSSRF